MENETLNKLYVPCGLNADWFCQAWHLGPGAVNGEDTSYYIVDPELSEGEYEIVKRAFNSETGEFSITPVAIGQLSDILLKAAKLISS